MEFDQPKGIVVLDVGSTNVKATLFDSDLKEHATQSLPCRYSQSPYLNKDIDPIIAFSRQVISDYDLILPVDTIVPTAHGSALALLDGSGALALPVMSYEAEPPDRIQAAYSRIEPEFNEVLAPTNPGALTLGRQLLWQQTLFPKQFVQVRTIVPLGQYIGFRLGGRLATEVTALGAQTHLWNPRANTYSQIARQHGWATLFAPIEPAWKPLGQAAITGLRGRGSILTGMHDSNANLLRYLDQSDFCLLSTGTWIIAFDPAVDVAGLEGQFDQVSNTSVFGQPVGCCRFMAGREFELIAQGADPRHADLDIAAQLIKQQVMAQPSFTQSGGPLPHTAGQGEIMGQLPDTPAARTSLAALYCAQMTATALQAMGAARRVIVDGPFSTNLVFLIALRQLLDGATVLTAQDQNGTSKGAAMLAMMPDGRLPAGASDLKPVQAHQFSGLSAFHLKWQQMARLDTIKP